MNKSKLGRFFAAVGVAAAASLGLVGAANAAPGDSGETEGTITVHKYENPPTAMEDPPEANGTEITTGLGGLRPLQDVVFKFEQVDSVDLSTNPGWQLAAEIAAGTKPVGTLTEIGTGCTTNAAGLCPSGQLPIGLYKVSEVSAPDGVTKADPFFVTVPMTDPTGLDDWMYNIHVYPKNVKTDVEKKPLDQDVYQVGQDVPFEITGTIPSGTITFYGFTDKLDSKLTYSATGTKMEFVDSAGNATALTPGDYVVTESSGLVSAYLTTTGLTEAEAFVAVNPGAKIKFTLNTTVNSAGEIDNTAQVFPNQPWTGWNTGNPTPPDPETCDPDTEDCGVPTEEVKTKFGGVTVKKIDAVDSNKTLAGAEFKIYSTATATWDGDPLNAQDVTTTACGSTCVTPANGELVINGLRYSTFVGGKDITPTDPGYRYYWLVETKAPAGYELLVKPVGFEVAAQAATIDLPVKNVEANGGWELPITGGSGIVAFVAGGILIIGAAVFGLARMRKAQK